MLVVVVFGLVVRLVVVQTVDDMLCPYEVQMMVVRILVDAITVVVHEVIVHDCVVAEFQGIVYVESEVKIVFFVIVTVAVILVFDVIWVYVSVVVITLVGLVAVVVESPMVVIEVVG